MLSEQIEALADRLAQYEGGPLLIDPEGVVWVLMILRDLADQARALEGAVVPAPSRLTAADLDANPKVTRIDRYRQRHSGRRPGNEGDAA